MAEVWMVRYDEGLYLFKDAATADQSIKDMYKGEKVTFEKEELSDQAYVYEIMKDGRMQDRVTVALCDVHEHPTVIHRFVTEIDPPLDYDRPPKKREEF